MKKTIIFFSILCGLNANAQSSWSLTGNSGTNATTNFLGTTDNQDLVFRSNNNERLAIDKNGRIGIGRGMNTLSTWANTDNNYELVSEGSSLFVTGENEYSFKVYNAPNDYTHIRVDSDQQNVFLQEDNGFTIVGSKIIPSCSDCNNYKLFVKDGIRTEKVKVDIAASNGWADYVFKKDYKLMPINELDQFITKNGHLPEVPTTEEAIKNGIELKEMNILLLKKIEELTLYTIEQQKKIEELGLNTINQQKRIEDLEKKLK